MPKDGLNAFLQERGFAGLNVTIPYKKAVLPFCGELSPLASRIGSVNTVTVDASGGLHGYNTDYFGFRRMLEEADLPVSGLHCVVIGAGGASATVCAVLEDLGAGRITVVSHRENTPEYLSTLSDAGLLVNTSPVGMYPKNGERPVDLSVFPALRGVADLIFNPLRTALLLQAEERGVPCAGGLTMLVAQAKQASELFQGGSLPDASIPSVTEEIRRQCESILLVGMPGSGKSVVGGVIARRTGKPFVDTDAEIELRAGKSIPEIFAQDGEDAFRRRDPPGEPPAAAAERARGVPRTTAPPACPPRSTAVLVRGRRAGAVQKPPPALPFRQRPARQQHPQRARHGPRRTERARLPHLQSGKIVRATPEKSVKNFTFSPKPIDKWSDACYTIARTQKR